MTTLLDLPVELLSLIFAQITRKDVKNLALTSHAYRHKLVWYILNLVHVTWDQVLELQNCTEDENTRVSSHNARFYCEHLLISNPNAYNEYQQNTFGQLLSPKIFPKLSAVSIRSQNLSNWIKYNKCAHIRSLQLINADLGPGRKVFCLGHLHDFSNLHELTLHNYHFDWLEEDIDANALPPISSLNLHDCTWQYPFNLAQFNPQDSLRTLMITYSKNNSFVLLERFLDFLEDPFPDHLHSIRHLEIGFTEYTENKKLLTLKILITLLHAFVGLDSLRLYGWYTTVLYMQKILSEFSFGFPVDIDVDVERQQQNLGPQNPHEKQLHMRWKQRLLNH